MASGEVRVGVGSGAKLSALARDLRKAGATSLRRELYRGLQRSGKPVIQKIKENAAKELPKGGGRGKRRTRLVSTGRTLTNAVSGKTHAIKERRKIGGGLAPGESVADRVVNASYVVRLVSNRGGVTLRLMATERGGKRIDLARLDKGELRHPVFGNRRVWVGQRVKPGWFTTPIEQNIGEFRKAIDDAVDAVIKEIDRG